MAGNLVQGAVFTVMVVRAGMLRDAAFEEELQQQVGRSPRFFLNAPVVLDLRDAEGFTTEEEFLDAGEAVAPAHAGLDRRAECAARHRSSAAAAAGLASFAPNSTQPSRRAAQPAAPRLSQQRRPR